MLGDGERGGLSPRSLLASANMVRQQSDTTGVRRLVRGAAIEDDRPQTSQASSWILKLVQSSKYSIVDTTSSSSLCV
ncbi:unnamed protein product [Strongylus vulgaris]|uniref:Uncharacterized protein n=1 Tax=Strongylus vulgaris TaxID=40348 RepID=A0A3P7JJI3_STRVU|nr:unnamed protein product [Strongylus vulgaris]